LFLSSPPLDLDEEAALSYLLHDGVQPYHRVSSHDRRAAETQRARTEAADQSMRYRKLEKEDERIAEGRGDDDGSEIVFEESPSFICGEMRGYQLHRGLKF